MKEPRFWSGDIDPRSREAAPLTRLLLSPFALSYRKLTERRLRRTVPLRVPATVICVGNLTAGGVGKSPVVEALRQRIAVTYKLRVASLSRGYGGKLKGPLKVDADHHSAADVGDEPLMLAATGEAWIGADRAAAGRAMTDDGVEVIIMDDGHQNPGLQKNFTFIVIDAATHFGNGHIIPKGPLRERVDTGLKRAQAIILMGQGAVPEAVLKSGRPILHAQIKPKTSLPQQSYVAFAGIGRPQKFFDTLKTLGVDIADAMPFPDHHTYTDGDVKFLRKLAADNQATLVTTTKDFVRLRPEYRRNVETLPVGVDFDDELAVDKLLEQIFEAHNGKA